MQPGKCILLAKGRHCLYPRSDPDPMRRSEGKICPHPAALPRVAAWGGGRFSHLLAGPADFPKCPEGGGDPLRLDVLLAPSTRGFALRRVGPLVVTPWVRFSAVVSPILGRRGTAIGLGARPSFGVLGISFRFHLSGRLPFFAGICFEGPPSLRSTSKRTSRRRFP